LSLVLASRSPQRSAILTQLGIAFTVRPADVDELAAGDPIAVAAANARRKALAVPREPHETVLGVDTLVTLDGEIFGKPTSAEHAAETLARLAGRTHTVVSGLTLVTDEGPSRAPDGPVDVNSVAETHVTFRDLTAAQIAAYVATGEWEGRAGGFAIQLTGGALIAKIDGDYLNVVGLPVQELVDLRPDLLPGGG
jgi:septum formation protein